MLKRLLFGFSANAFGIIVGMAIQICALPLFLLHWDAARYGGWLLLSAVPSYLTMADAGLVCTAGNRMTIAAGREDFAEANRVYQTAQVFLAIICLGLALIVAPVALLAPLPDVIAPEGRWAILWLAAGVLVALYAGLSEAVFKATGRYALGTAWGHASRLLEFVGFVAGLMAAGDYASVAFGGFVARLLAAATMMVLAHRGRQDLRMGFAEADVSELRAMATPAVSFMAFPLANAINYQGVTLMVGGLVGASGVALFATYRTVARLAVQVTSIFGLALWPEFSRLHGAGRTADLARLYRWSVLLGAAGSIALSALLYVAAPKLLEVWTLGRIPFDAIVMAELLIYAAIGGIWYAPRMILLATNNHGALALCSLATGAAAVGLSAVLGAQWRLQGVAAGLILSELAIAGVSLRMAHKTFLANACEPTAAPGEFNSAGAAR